MKKKRRRKKENIRKYLLVLFFVVPLLFLYFKCSLCICLSLIRIGLHRIFVSLVKVENLNILTLALHDRPLNSCSTYGRIWCGEKLLHSIYISNPYLFWNSLVNLNYTYQPFVFIYNMRLCIIIHCYCLQFKMFLAFFFFTLIHSIDSVYWCSNQT